MKKFFLLFGLLLLAAMTFAQAPQAMANEDYNSTTTDTTFSIPGSNPTGIMVSGNEFLAPDETGGKTTNQHQISVSQGWNGFSSYVIPDNPDIENLFLPVQDQLIILYNLTGSYIPSQQVNTLINWNPQSGYIAKFSQNTDFEISGQATQDGILNLTTGWNLIPVLSSCPVNVHDFFENYELAIVKEVSGWKLYWPEMGINTILELIPGEAYFVMMNGTAEINFPDCENFPPEAPYSPFPENGSINQLLTTTLSWQCTDPENDPLTFDLYFGTTNPPEMLQSGIGNLSYTPDQLQHSTTYYWKIVAFDTYGNSAESAIWNFETMSCIVPSVYAGQDATLPCESNNYTLSGATASNYSSLFWESSGDGTFDNSATLNAVYTRGLQDITNGAITITLTASSGEPCNITTYDELHLTINPVPMVNAGPDQTVCCGDEVYLNPIAQNFTQVMWYCSDCLGSFSDEQQLNTIYYSHYFDCMMSSIHLYVLLDPISPCSFSASDMVVVYFDLEPPIVNAGPDQFIPDSTSTFLQGNTPSSGENGVWTIIDGFGGNITDPDSPTSEFIGLFDHTYILEWTMYSDGGCSSRDQVLISFGCFPQPTPANAGNDLLNICPSTLALQGNTPIYGVGEWSIVSGFGGSFADSTNPETIFTGQPETTYLLRWTITTECNISQDEVVIGFNNWTCGNAFTDTRDDKIYTTLQLGIQCWLAQNLNVGTRINGSSNQSDNGIIEKYCYDNSESNCDVYGGLYQWNEMMEYSTTPGVQGICPIGWHLPSDIDWTTLTTFISSQPAYLCNSNSSYIAKALASNTNWNTSTGTCTVGNNLSANNATGFTALPGGSRHYYMSFNYLSNSGYWWSSTENSTSNAWDRDIFNYSANVSRYYSYKSNGFSVRCIKD